jgi:hypothetical protein
VRGPFFVLAFGNGCGFRAQRWGFGLDGGADQGVIVRIFRGLEKKLLIFLATRRRRGFRGIGAFLWEDLIIFGLTICHETLIIANNILLKPGGCHAASSCLAVPLC